MVDRHLLKSDSSLKCELFCEASKEKNIFGVFPIFPFSSQGSTGKN